LHAEPIKFVIIVVV